VWYSFVATATDHSITVDPSDSLSVVIELHENDCSGTNLVTCLEGDNFGTVEQMDATGLTIGTTYYVRIYDWYAGSPNSTAFTICLTGPGCTANAGTLTADATEVCIVAHAADISATPNGDAVVPAGFEVLYLLATGAQQSILQSSGSPDFTVLSTGAYSVHTLVYDPLTFDTANIDLGISSIVDVGSFFIQGGGATCGGLDMAGASIDVIDCPCPAFAGTLTSDDTLVCLVAISELISATPDGNASVPPGFTTLYLLTALSW
jgi:hypothetical protein